MPQLKVTDKSDVVSVSFNATKILDKDSINEIGTELMQAARKAAGGKLVLNFDRVAFMSSAMLGQIMQLAKQVKTDSTELKLCGISPDILEVFKLTKLDKVLDIRKTEAEAIEAFDAPKKKGWFG